MNMLEKRPIVFTAMSKYSFHLKDIITAFVLKQGGVPLNPFMSFGYFMGDMVERDLVRRANNNMVRISDELWCFGTIADGVAFEITKSMETNKRIRFFSINGHGTNIKEITDLGTDCTNLDFEVGIEGITELKTKLSKYLLM